MTKTLETHLKDACQLTGAAWAVIADREKEQWFIEAACKLPKSKQSSLVRLLNDGTIYMPIDEAPRAKDVLSTVVPQDSGLGVSRLSVFTINNTSSIILVGGRKPNTGQRRLWRLIAAVLPSIDSVVEVVNPWPGVQVELGDDMPRAIDRVLGAFVRLVVAQGAWLAIRRGDTLDVIAQRNDSHLAGRGFSIESNRLLRRANRTLTDISTVLGQSDWPNLPHEVRKSTRYWICFPLVVGQRMIGMVALWGTQEFRPQEIKRLRTLSRQVAQAVDVIVTFDELTGHLRRLAMLNDFALAVSSAQNLDQIARRVFGYLARSFHTELIALYLPSIESKLIREFRDQDGKFGLQTAALSDHPMLPYLKGRILRLKDSAPEFRPIYKGARSSLIVPLKYRSQTMGLLALESTRTDAFSQYDEHLMVVIASHLAGLIEYGRLREEAEARARNLGLIHEVVQQVIGLSDKKEVAQITADLLARYFAYELAIVMLAGDNQDHPILGLGGSRAELVQSLFLTEDLVHPEGVTGRVLHTGASLLINDTSSENSVRLPSGWQAGSEMCVALKDGDHILGFIDVESSQHNAFNNNDLLAIESLGGVLATVVSSANQYERLQETIRQLSEAQVESRARLRAQQEAEGRLVQAAKLVAVGEMAAGIAHELNNPLTTVTGFTELILDETPADAPHRADVEMVLHEALRARGVVRRLLDFARQGDRARAKCDINEIVDDVLALTKHFIHTSGVQLEVEFGRNLPWVSVDSNQMKQVFLNLVHNSLQAMPTGGDLRITTSSSRKDERDWVVARVSDSGIGIDAKDIDRIFEPFFTTKGSRGGTGLGLSVTYGIVTDHGGTIEVESRPGEGSTFAVWLPI